MPTSAPIALLLHGMYGGWDELIVLAGGIILAVVVVKMTNRSAKQDSDEESLSPGETTAEPRPEQP